MKTPATPLKALILDDERHIARLCARALKKSGAEVDVTGTAAEAAARIRSVPYDLLVCDLRLPDGDGLEVAALFRTLRPNGRVLIVTGSLLTKNSARIAEAAVHPIVFKPFGLNEFRQAVARTLHLPPRRPSP